MSIEAHPNLQAVAVTVDINNSIMRNLRGNGLKKKDKVVYDEKLKDMVVNFIVDISTRIDEVVSDDDS